jgi:uncharacterized protein with gpF-like domain
MKFKAWEARRHIENSYKTALRKLGRFLVGLIGDSDTVDTISNKFSTIYSSNPFQAWAEALAHTFVTHTLEENAHTWRQAAAKSGQGSTIRLALEHELEGPVGDRVRELIDQNAQYIKSVPENVSKDLVRHVASKAYAGSRAAYRSDEFKRMVGGMSNAHAKLISRTETSKAMSVLTQARAEYTGHDWYIWHTAEDVRVRKSHQKMDKVLCRFSDPPAPEELVGEKSVGHYGPGNIYNCRCFAEPIIVWDEIEWPHKVCFDGAVSTMSKKQFQNTFEIGV